MSDQPVARALDAEMRWLSACIDARIRTHFAAEPTPVVFPPAPPLDRASRYHDLLQRIGAGDAERLLLALSLAPHVAPHVLDVFFLRNQQTDRGFTEFGGLKGTQHAGFLPTGETALFLLGGDDPVARVHALRLLDRQHPLHTIGALHLDAAPTREPQTSGALTFAPEWLRHLVDGSEPRPEMGPAFPARPVTTRLTWDDLVLDADARREVETIEAWARHAESLRDAWGLGRHLGRGFSALFHGPSGTGKSLTAALLGQRLERDVYRIDLSQVVSKYIGETEKNLGRVFEEAERRGWLLFFDEADALFGRRTTTSNAHDRYANQEVAYLLQRIEEHVGITILATNLRGNIDDAFVRRFQVIVHFAPPDVAQRERLWRTMLGPQVPRADDVDCAALARDHELTGGQIVNIVCHACLDARSRASALQLADLQRAIRRERRKEGRS